MLRWIKIFFGFAPDPRQAEGFFSPAHLVFVGCMLLITVLIAVKSAAEYRTATRKARVAPLKRAAVCMLSLESIKAVILCARGDGLVELRGILPLFLCSVMLFALPLAAFARGRMQEAALDFSLCFGPLCAVAGTVLAGNIFSSPIVSFDVLVSVTTHCISGFAGVYIGAAGLADMKRKNIPITALILLLFELTAYAVDLWQLSTPYQSNYMFFTSPDGTPYSILESVAGGTGPLYAFLVAMTYFAYLFLFELIWFGVKKIKHPENGR